jgi:hypothetical protein
VAGNPRTLNMPVYEKLNGFTSGSLWYGAGIGCVGYKSTPSFPSISCEWEHYWTNNTSLPQFLITRNSFNCSMRTECKIFFLFPVCWSLDKNVRDSDEYTPIYLIVAFLENAAWHRNVDQIQFFPFIQCYHFVTVIFLGYSKAK